MTFEHLELAGGKTIAVRKEPSMQNGSTRSKAIIYAEGRSLFIEEHGLSGPEDKVQHCRTLEIPLSDEQCDELMDMLRDVKKGRRP